MNITKIHGKYYDLTDFNHPGGDDAIWNSYGRDATVMFEQYHPMVNKTFLETTLNRYEVPENKIMEAKKHLLPDEDNIFQFEFKSVFAQELKEEVKLHFITKAKTESTTIRKVTKASTSKWISVITCLLLYFFTGLLWLQGSYIGLILFPLIQWLNFVTFHDACHFCLSDKPVINKVFSFILPDFSFPYLWYLQHNVSHHCYTNIHKKDPDLHHGTYIVRESLSTKFSFLNKYQPYLFIIKWLLYYGNVIRNSFRLLFGKVYKCVYSNNVPMIHKIYPIIYFFIRYCYCYYYFQKQITYVIVPTLVFAFLSMLNIQITHLHEDTFHNESDWYKYQVLTSSSHSIGSTFGYVFSGGANYQIEHHLFPGINHCHYPEIQPIVKSICLKHNIAYKEFHGYYDAFCSYYNHIKTLSKNKKDFE